ncbi:type 1 glutamine amidotransferase [Candidatus Caldatribacterium sp.]|uniref:type 1 glutamine amidotransferase n=1 Tax=Candidatus Caldatribacterium sp. TaxID=2282143 RepID=UPI00383EC179|nr:type 1 glutamine amidotransferase [Candidatus Caldatribacterium sp.]
MKRALVVQHVTLEGPGLLSAALKERGWNLDLRVMDVRGTRLPCSLREYHAFLILGGPMGAYEEAKYPYLFDVEALICEGVSRGIPIVGICLGGQLIARAFQAEVRPNAVKEIGWYPLLLTAYGRTSPLFFGLPDSFSVFQWHGDTFELPYGASLLATGKTCRNQAFLYRGCALALQFHPEVTLEMISSWIEAYSGELVEFGGPEAVEQLRKETERRWQEDGAIRKHLLENLCRFLEGGM